MLPDVNGWELCTRIKGDVRFNHIPVIILTAKNGIDDRIASYEAGADGYIAKPFELRILFARVDKSDTILADASGGVPQGGKYQLGRLDVPIGR